jgi:hypothetical protein
MPRMRRLSMFILAAVCAVVLAACGSSSTKSSSGGGATAPPAPLTTALSYFPSGTPLVATITTDPKNQSLKDIESSTPDATLIKAAVFQELAKLGVNYNKDVKPLFGNPIALGIASDNVTSSSTPFLAAWQTESASALKDLIAKLKGYKVTGHHDGATIYAVQGTGALAVDGATVLVSNDTDTIDSALDRHAAKSGFSSAQYTQDTSGLPGDGAVSLVGDLTQVLAQPSAAQARKIPWVAAIRSYGVTVGSAQHAVTLHFRLDTAGRPLSPAQLPIASGTAAPALAGDMPIQFSVRDPAQIFDFVKSALKVASPKDYQQLIRGEARIKQRNGVDFEQIIHSLTGSLEFETNEHAVLARVPVDSSKIPDVDKVLRDPGAGKLLDRGTTSRSLGGGLYVISQTSDPTNPIVAGVVGNELVIGAMATAAQVRAYAKAPETQAGGSGSVVYKLALDKLLGLALGNQPNPIVQQLASKLGDLSGSVQATASALTGTATLTEK